MYRVATEWAIVQDLWLTFIEIQTLLCRRISFELKRFCDTIENLIWSSFNHSRSLPFSVFRLFLTFFTLNFNNQSENTILIYSKHLKRTFFRFASICLWCNFVYFIFHWNDICVQGNIGKAFKIVLCTRFAMVLTFCTEIKHFNQEQKRYLWKCECIFEWFSIAWPKWRKNICENAFKWIAYSMFEFWN